MGLLDWLTGRKVKAAKAVPQTASPKSPAARPPNLNDGVTSPPAAPVYRIRGGFLYLNDRDYYGFFQRSPNGRYIVSWIEGSHTAGEKKKLGRYVLLADGQITAQGRIERPNDGMVADNGTFIINDWHFFSSELSGTFRAFRADGKPLITRRFTANLFNNGLSKDGRYAVCQTCNSGTADSSKLTIFDLGAAREIASFLPESGWAQSYEFPPGGDVVRLTYGDGGSYAYALDGTFVDRARWIEDHLAAGDMYMVARLLGEADNQPAPELARRVLPALEKGLTSDLAKDPRTKAWGQRLYGLCLETLNEPTRALAAYDEALSLNPKVGVKKRAAALRKELSVADDVAIAAHDRCVKP